MTTVRLFAVLRDLAGASSLEMEAADVGSVLDQLSSRLGPEFDRIMAAGSVVVNGERSDRSRVVTAGDEVALLPPVSGGYQPAAAGISARWCGWLLHRRSTLGG